MTTLYRAYIQGKPGDAGPTWVLIDQTERERLDAIRAESGDDADPVTMYSIDKEPPHGPGPEYAVRLSTLILEPDVL